MDYLPTFEQSKDIALYGSLAAVGAFSGYMIFDEFICYYTNKYKWLPSVIVGVSLPVAYYYSSKK